MSPLDATWGTLFRHTGDPTRRMGDVLRGLATYLVTERDRPLLAAVRC